MTGPEMTAAIERGGRAIWEHDNGHTTWPPRDPLEIGPAQDAARAALDAALDGEEIGAAVVEAEYGWTGRLPVRGVNPDDHPSLPRFVAAVLRAAILGGAS